MDGFSRWTLRPVGRTAAAMLAGIMAVAGSLSGCGSGGGGTAADVAGAPAGSDAAGVASQPAPVPANAVRLTQLWTATKTGPGAGPPDLDIRGFDLGTRYLWVVRERTSTKSAENVFYALTSTDLVNFTSQPILLDGVAAGYPAGSNAFYTSVPPQKILPFKGKYVGWAYHQGPGSTNIGPSHLYTSDDALNWTSLRGVTAGQNQFWFHNDEVPVHCPPVPIPNQYCEWVEDVETDETGTALYVLLRSWLLKTTDGTTWTATNFARSCRTADGTQPQTYSELEIRGNTVLLGGRESLHPSCLSNDGGATWQSGMPQVAMGGFQADMYGVALQPVFSVGDRFYSSGGYTYRNWWLTSQDGVQWEAIAGPTPLNCRHTPFTDSIAFNGNMFLTLEQICLDDPDIGDTTYGIAVSTDGIHWQHRPITGVVSPGLAPSHEAGILKGLGGGILRNFVVVRGTNDVIVTGTADRMQGTSLNPVFGLVRIHLD